jgi:predicted ATPase/DNA-binding winged helix-turn-helix (wHTH) protein
MTRNATRPRQFAFGPFRLLPAQELLLEGEAPVRLGGRARDLLIALLEQAGQVITKEALSARLWPNIAVVEGTLRVHVAALRKALRDGQEGRRYITNIAGRGYAFVGEVVATDAPGPAAEAPPGPTPPLYVGHLFGRAEVVETLSTRLAQQRLIAITGPGGIGKTSVALAVTDRMRQGLPDGVCVVDFAPLVDSKLVPTALASALGVGVVSENPLPSLVALLRNREMLIVLDNCEHVIDAAAVLTESLLQGSARLRILATSREAMRVPGEMLFRLAPLAMPEVSDGLTASVAMTYSAVQLFVERAAMCMGEFSLTDALAPAVANICRRLDGIPLAIEMAAGRVDVFGIAGLASVLDDRFRLAMRGRRTALPRHRTLAAALDWSYEILPEYERTILRRLGVFAGPFTLASASAVLADSGIAAPNVVAGVANLVAKSLVPADVSGAVAHYRLLETTRAYASGKLKEAGEDEQVARLHAKLFRDRFVAAAIARSGHSSVAEMHEYVRDIDNVRSAIDWSFSKGGEPAIGVALTAAFSPVWLSLSLMVELRDRAQHALRMKDVDSELLGPRERAERELDLQMALGPALVATKLHGHPDIGQTYARAWELCQQLGDHSRGFTALRGLQVYHQNLIEIKKAQHFAEEALRVAERLDDPARLVGGHMAVGATLYWQGKLEPALAHFRRGLELFDPDTQFLDWPGSHPGLQCQLFPMQISWMLGYPDRSLDELRAVVGSAETLGHSVTLVRALCYAALVYSFRHEPSAVADHAERALRICEERGIETFRGLALCANGWALGVSGQSENGLAQIAHGLDSYGLGVSQHALLALQADVQLAMGKPEAALASVAAGLEAVERMGGGPLEAELHRLKGQALLAGAGTVSEAETAIRRGIEVACRQNALSWELRAATSLALLWHQNGRTEEAEKLLGSVYNRFSEGFETADLTTARALTDTFRDSLSAARGPLRRTRRLAQ